MTDAHVHLERGPYTLAWVGKFAEAAAARGLDELCLLEHGHRFLEFRGCYREVEDYSDYQRAWLGRKAGVRLRDYLALVDECRRAKWPVKLKFGLEVCYFPGREREIESLCRGLDLDFLTGSVHWIDGWGFDHGPESWEGRDIGAVYARYFEIMGELVDSGLFGRLAHPDSIKCFGARCPYPLGESYERLAGKLAARGVEAEESGGLFLNYGLPRTGMEEGMLAAFAAAGVRIVAASDAHRPEDAGRTVAESEARVARAYAAAGRPAPGLGRPRGGPPPRDRGPS